ncbi:YtxH domain-containing protein [Ferdinandcohnia sp. Marseille-Q9671]
MTPTKSLLCGVIVGSIFGGISVLLSTPTSGKEIRKKVKDNQIQITSSLSEVIKEGKKLKEQVALSTKQAANTITEVSGELKSSINLWKKEIEENQKSIQKELLEIENALENLEKKVISQ